MKKFLIVLFMIFRNCSFALNFNIDVRPLNPKVEAMGSTGMTFGEEYGSLYLSPTAHSYSKKFITGGLNINVYECCKRDTISYGYSRDTASLNISLKVGNFNIGLSKTKTEKSLSFFSKPLRLANSIHDTLWINKFFCVPMSFVTKMRGFNIGIGLKLIYYEVSSNIDLIKKIYKYNNSSLYLTPDIGLSHNSPLGIFTISLSNLRSFFDDYSKNISLISNLRIGYGYGREYIKEYIKVIETKLNSLLKRTLSLKIALELDNLLMQGNKTNYDILPQGNKRIYDNVRIQDNRRNYYLLKNIRLGVELSSFYEYKNLAFYYYDFIAFRFGIKNLYCTFGLCIGIAKILLFEYTFTNEDLEEEGTRVKTVNMLSLSFGNFN